MSSKKASASKAKSSVLSELSSLENVLFNDFIDDELDSEVMSEQRASASLPDPAMLEDVPQDIVFKTLKVSCACVAVLVLACECVCDRVRAVDKCS
jgi:hypothetical protein